MQINIKTIVIDMTMVIIMTMIFYTLINFNVTCHKIRNYIDGGVIVTMTNPAYETPPDKKYISILKRRTT